MTDTTPAALLIRVLTALDKSPTFSVSYAGLGDDSLVNLDASDGLTLCGDEDYEAMIQTIAALRNSIPAWIDLLRDTIAHSYIDGCFAEAVLDAIHAAVGDARWAELCEVQE